MCVIWSSICSVWFNVEKKWQLDMKFTEHNLSQSLDLKSPFEIFIIISVQES